MVSSRDSRAPSDGGIGRRATHHQARRPGERGGPGRRKIDRVSAPVVRSIQRDARKSGHAVAGDGAAAREHRHQRRARRPRELARSAARRGRLGNWPLPWRDQAHPSDSGRARSLSVADFRRPPRRPAQEADRTDTQINSRMKRAPVRTIALAVAFITLALTTAAVRTSPSYAAAKKPTITV